METAYNSPRTKPLYRGVQVVNYILSILEVLLALRFFLRLFGANPGAPFTAFIYNLSYPFVAPFLTVFRVTRVEGSVFEWTTLLAMIIYSILASIIIRLFVIQKPVSTYEAAAKLEQHDDDE